MISVANAVTALFVPADRPDRYGKAAASGADLVIVDLEDAVAAGAKDAARDAVVAALSPGEGVPLQAVVRVNDATSRELISDLAALSAVAGRPGHGLLGVMIPKADDPEALAEVVGALAAHEGPPLALVPLIESAAGLVDVLTLARVSGVTRLAFGALDLSLDLDADPTGPVTGYAAAQIVVASRVAGLAAPLNSPSTEIVDLEQVTASARAARAAGFAGQLCIHPAQIGPVRAAFAATPEQVAWARTVAQAEDGATNVDGRMIDRPVRERARRILRRVDGAQD